MVKEYNVTIQYNDGGKDTFYHARIIGFKDGVLRLKESNGRDIFIPINNMAYWTREDI